MGKVRRFAALATLLVAAGTMAGLAVAGGSSSTRLDIYGPDFQYNCALESIGNPETPTGSTANFLYHKGSNTVNGTVHLRGMTPGTNLQVRLIQGVDDCYTIDGYVTIDSLGKGTLQISEAAVSQKASLFIWGADYTGSFFMSAVYNHA